MAQIHLCCQKQIAQISHVFAQSQTKARILVAYDCDFIYDKICEIVASTVWHIQSSLNLLRKFDVLAN